MNSSWFSSRSIIHFNFKLKHFILLLLYGRYYGFYIINVPIVASQLENFVHKSTVDFSKWVHMWISGFVICCSKSALWKVEDLCKHAWHLAAELGNIKSSKTLLFKCIMYYWKELLFIIHWDALSKRMLKVIVSCHFPGICHVRGT